jgi:hypothetical protein
MLRVMESPAPSLLILIASHRTQPANPLTHACVQSVGLQESRSPAATRLPQFTMSHLDGMCCNCKGLSVLLEYGSLKTDPP